MYFINLIVCETVVYSGILLVTKIKKELCSTFHKKYPIFLLDCEIHPSYGRNSGAVFLEKTPTEYFEDSI